MDVPETPTKPPDSRGRPYREQSFYFSSGEVLSTSFAIFGRHLPILVGLAALFHALPTLLNIKRAGVVQDVPNEPGMHFWFEGPYGIATALASWVLPLAFQAVVTFAVFRTLRGGPPNYADSVSRGFRRFLLALGSSLVVSVALFLPMLVAFMLLGGGGSEGLVVLLMLGGLVYLVVMGCAWFVSVQAAVVEGVNPFTSMSRSAEPTRGARFGIFSVMLVVFGVPGLLHGIADAVAFSHLGHDEITIPRVLLEAGFDVLFAGLQAVATVVVYHALRKGKEGVGLDELLAVFD